MRSFTFFSKLFLANVSKCKFLNLFYTIGMNIYENIRHSIDIFDEISILWRSIFSSSSIRWHLKFRFRPELCLCMWLCLYIILHVLLCSSLFLKRTHSYFSRSLHLGVGLCLYFYIRSVSFLKTITMGWV